MFVFVLQTRTRRFLVKFLCISLQFQQMCVFFFQFFSSLFSWRWSGWWKTMCICVFTYGTAITSKMLSCESISMFIVDFLKATQLSLHSVPANHFICIWILCVCVRVWASAQDSFTETFFTILEVSFAVVRLCLQFYY